MSVIVDQLTKIYGHQKAVDDVSFEVKKGEVLGFLGPNGAGKTTTMKVITCYLPQTMGKVSVCGYDTAKAPIEVRKSIGYLPEHNPLYKEMYVKEYLWFIAGIHKVKNKRSRIAEMIERTGLEREQKKLIGALSKGYRQRVGLAQAMLHDPQVLILDEPTSGLDPNQLVEIRQLIKEFGKEKTVVFSTHIMQEVQAICDRVIIINQGKLVANDSIDRLEKLISGETVLTIEFDKALEHAVLKKIEGVKKVEFVEGNKLRVSSDSNVDLRPALFDLASEKGVRILEMHKEVFSVEDVFHKLTKS